MPASPPCRRPPTSKRPLADAAPGCVPGLGGSSNMAGGSPCRVLRRTGTGRRIASICCRVVAPAGGTERHLEITCDRWQRAQVPGLIVHETGVLPPEDVTEREGLPCMTVERTLLSLGAVASSSTVEIAVDTALRREVTTVDALGAIVRRLGRRGRNGVGVLRRVPRDARPRGGHAGERDGDATQAAVASRRTADTGRSSSKSATSIASSPESMPHTPTCSSRSSTTATNTTRVEPRSSGTAAAATPSSVSVGRRSPSPQPTSTPVERRSSAPFGPRALVLA